MTTRLRRLALLLALPLLLTGLTAPPAGADAVAPAGAAARDGYVEEVSAFFSEDGDLDLFQDTRTSRRVSVISHDYALDVRGGKRADLVVLFSRSDGRPRVYTARDYDRVRCRGATGRYVRGGRSEATIPGRCLGEDGVAPARVTVRPSVLVQVKRRSGTTCVVEEGPRLGPLGRGEGEGAVSPAGPQPVATHPGRRGC